MRKVNLPGAEGVLRITLAVFGGAMAVAGVEEAVRQGEAIPFLIVAGPIALALAYFGPRLTSLRAQVGEASVEAVLGKQAEIARQAVEHAESLQSVDAVRGTLEAVAKSIESFSAKEEAFRLSGPPQPRQADELPLWPFAALALPDDDGGFELQLVSLSPVPGATDPIDVMCVVTDPHARSFTVEKRLTRMVSKRVAIFRWPDEFTSGDFVSGNFDVNWFVAPIAVGPSRQFQFVAYTDFNYQHDYSRRPDQARPTS
jgi:hypothetical protein